MTVEVREFFTPRNRQAFMFTRDDTMDGDVCTSSMMQDEYRLKEREPMEGWAIDVGAHIGAVTVALALDNPKLRIVALEIVPENVELLTENLVRNKVDDRVTVVHAAAGGDDELSRTCFMRHRSHPAAERAYVNAHRFIGNSFWSLAAGGAFDSEAVEMDTISLGELMDQHGIAEVEFLKTDCEGCEWAFLNTPDIAKVKNIIGEYHWDYAPQGDVATHREGAILHQRQPTAQEELHAMFDATHVLEVGDHPTIGLFTAVRR